MTIETLYKLVEGLPSVVETEVNKLLAQGWEILSPPYPRINADGIHLTVQPMTISRPETVEERDVLGQLVKQHKTQHRNIV